jgi:hypothetical protein
MIFFCKVNELQYYGTTGLDRACLASYKLQVATLFLRSGFNGEQQAGPKHKTSVMRRDSRLLPTIVPGHLSDITCYSPVVGSATAVTVSKTCSQLAQNLLVASKLLPHILGSRTPRRPRKRAQGFSDMLNPMAFSRAREPWVAHNPQLAVGGCSELA